MGMNAIKYEIRVFTGFLPFFSLLVMTSACSVDEPGKKKPNIILIVADDMGSGVPDCYGGQSIHTPNIDKLAMGGMLFTRAYSGCSVCAPSRASLITGKHAGHVSVRGNTGGIPLPDNDTTFAEILKKAGYAVGGFGKWGLGDVGTEGVPEKQGFDVFFGYYHQIHAHFYYTDYLWKNSEMIDLPNIHGDSSSYSHYRIMEEMKQFIRNNRSQPFFCFGSWTLPHVDDEGDPRIPLDDPAYLQYKDKPWSDDEKKYAAMNTRVDHDLGEILDLLRNLGLDRNTVVIFTSDNGGGIEFDATFDVNGTLRGFKHQFYEGGIRVPLIFYWPARVEGGTTCEMPCYFADMLPTILDLAGAGDKIPSRLDGFSLVPFLTDNGIQYKHDYMYWELPAFDWSEFRYVPNGLQQAILMEDWKLLRHDITVPWELYNLTSDPAEQKDLAEQYPGIVERLQETIITNRTEVPDQVEPEMPEGKWYR